VEANRIIDKNRLYEFK